MIAWTIIWLYFRLEFVIDWGKGGSLIIEWLPSISTTVSEPDENGFRMMMLEAHFLIFGIQLCHYYPAIFKYNEVGEVIGKNTFECFVTQI